MKCETIRLKYNQLLMISRYTQRNIIRVIFDDYVYPRTRQKEKVVIEDSGVGWVTVRVPQRKHKKK